ncbi:hypothetical protein [Paenibacillus gansuensis]|uniref:DUF4190 domain-containing protein n=1 Tax=Paenibacillus gansuensis TaxID=306542 RepID=A0ABW5PET3_9BACL
MSDQLQPASNIGGTQEEQAHKKTESFPGKPVFHTPHPSGRPNSGVSGLGRPWTVNASVVCGLLALLCNLALIGAPLGILLGIVALAFSLPHVTRYPAAAAGLLLTCTAFVILTVYVLTASAFLSDPTLSLISLLEKIAAMDT